MLLNGRVTGMAFISWGGLPGIPACLRKDTNWSVRRWNSLSRTGHWSGASRRRYRRVLLQLPLSFEPLPEIIQHAQAYLEEAPSAGTLDACLIVYQPYLGDGYSLDWSTSDLAA